MVKQLKAQWEEAYKALEAKLIPFLPGEVFDYLRELEKKLSITIEDASDIHSQPDGSLAGRVLIAGHWLPFKGDTLITTIAGQKIEDASFIHSQPDGSLAGRVQIAGQLHYFFWHDEKRSLLVP